jgi:hypothetical protein
MATMTPSLADVTAQFLGSVSTQRMLKVVAEISEHDRYQASHGAEQVAGLVAGEAESAGLAGVEIHRFAADGRAHWWSFAAPSAWTPLRAQLEVGTPGERGVLVDHRRDPFTIATYSAATPPEGLVLPLLAMDDDGPLLAEVAGALVLIDRTVGPLPLVALREAGAAGFVTDAACVRDRDLQYAGRIELEPGSPLIGFSVTSSCLKRLKGLASAGARARVHVDVDGSACMPAVSGILRGRRPGREIWLMAHLCHPRPSANDNASGVAALLAVVGALASAGRADPARIPDRTLRFIWSPEFVGPAAVLWTRLAKEGDAALPAAALNLDMVGEDQERCGGPFLVERPPAGTPSILAPLAEHLVAEAFAQTESHPGTWRPVPFAGSSDHAVLAGPNVHCPALALCHAPDSFNHSAADDIDKVSAVELRRSAAAAAAIAHVAADGSRVQRASIAAAVNDWCERELRRATTVARRYADVDDGAWSDGLLRYVQWELEATRALPMNLTTPQTKTRGPADTEKPELMERWAGPLNVRALLDDLSVSTRSEVRSLIAADKANYSVLVNLAVRASGGLGRRGLLQEVSYGLRRPIDPETGRFLVEALLESGWIAESLGREPAA